MSLSAGTLGKYQIIREIARSNDIVYEAWDPALNRRVALKELVIPPHATPGQAEDRIRRFEREARAAGTLAHPNIVTIYDVGQDGDRHFIAMEYLEGESLRQLLDRVGALGEAEAIRIVAQVLAGLAHAHDKGIVHRDVKPDNIHILPDGRVKITDLGIARLTFESKLTVTGQVLGTPSYMSPEQVQDEDIDARSDVWSVGVVLYEAICGTKPFTGSGVMAIAYSVLHDQPADPPGASSGTIQLIRSALNKSPDGRFANAGIMLRALANVSGQPPTQPVQQPANTTLPSSPQQPAANPHIPVPQKVLNLPQRHSFSIPGLAVAGLLCLVVIVLAQFYFLLQGQSEENLPSPFETPQQSQISEPPQANESAPESPSLDNNKINESPLGSQDTLNSSAGPRSLAPTESEVYALLRKWEDAQDRRNFVSYKRLYSTTFWGIRRTYRSNGTQVVFKGGYQEWMTDRERMLRSAIAVNVDIFDIEQSLDNDNQVMVVRFFQTYESINARTGKRWGDMGEKVMRIAREGNDCKIIYEELLYSEPYR